MARERDIRTAIADALARTGNIPAENVHLAAADEAAAKDGDPLVVAIEPHSTTLMPSGPMSTSVSARSAIGWDSSTAGSLPFLTQILITVIARDQDPETRDDLAEQMLAAAQNAVNGQVLVEGFTSPMDTLVGNWTWAKPVAPERRVAAIARVMYLVPAWNEFDTSG